MGEPKLEHLTAGDRAMIARARSAFTMLVGLEKGDEYADKIAVDRNEKRAAQK